MAGLAHNVLKAVRRLRQGSGPPEPLKPGPVPCSADRSEEFWDTSLPGTDECLRDNRRGTDESSRRPLTHRPPRARSPRPFRLFQQAHPAALDTWRYKGSAHDNPPNGRPYQGPPGLGHLLRITHTRHPKKTRPTEEHRRKGAAQQRSKAGHTVDDAQHFVHTTKIKQTPTSAFYH